MAGNSLVIVFSCAVFNFQMFSYDTCQLSPIQHLRDLNEVFQRYKKGRNFIFAHCYGALHTLRLLKLLSDKEMLYEISGVALLALGKRNPVSASWIKYVPSTILG